MSTATFLQPTETQFEGLIEHSFGQPESWKRVDQAYPEIEEQAWADTRREIGAIALDNTLQSQPTNNQNSSSTLMYAAKRAPYDIKSYRQTRTNVEKEIPERLLKVGLVSETFMEHEPGLGIVQDGRPIAEIYANSLRFARLQGEMLQRGSIEHKNAGVINQLADAGVLDEHDVLIMSLASTKKEVIERYGISEKYMAASLQLVSKDENEVICDTALVAGKKNPEAERDDIAAVIELARRHGIDIDTTNPAELLDIVILIPKGELSNGIAGVVEELDEIRGGTFYGQEGVAREDYARHAEQQRALKFEDIVDAITDILIQEAPTFKHPMQAVKRLGQLADYFTVQYSIENDNIDIDIFGPTSAKLIAKARKAFKEGDEMGVIELTSLAHDSSTNSSCPMDMSSGFDEYGSLNFDCPGCMSINTREPGKLLPNCKECNMEIPKCD